MTTPDPNPIYTGLIAEKGLPGAQEPATGATETTAESAASAPAEGAGGDG